MEGLHSVDDVSQHLRRQRVAVPADWRLELRTLHAEVSRTIVEELFVALGCTMWWIVCFGATGALGYLVAEGEGLVLGLLIGSTVAVVGWLVTVGEAIRTLVHTWWNPTG